MSRPAPEEGKAGPAGRASEDPVLEDRAMVRHRVWESLRRVARPDSRFHWNFNEFIPDFEGSDHAARTLRGMDLYRRAHHVFVTPDNGLALVRRFCMEDRKELLVSSYGIARGFLRVRPGSIPPERLDYAATLDGLDYVAEAVTLAELKGGPPLDLLVTGAAAISREGVRFGKGHGYFDLEWGIFSEIGLADHRTPVVAIVHDCQVVDARLPSTELDTVVDWIITPTRVLQPEGSRAKPRGIAWELLEPGMVEAVPPLRELQELSGRGRR